MTNTTQTSVLITGGNKGLGLEAARRLGQRGWKVFLGSRDPGRGRTAADKLAADGTDVVMVPLDVTSDRSVTDPDQPVSQMHELAYSSSKAALHMITVRYAQALPRIKFNVATPGEVANHKIAATDMNRHTGELTVTEGTDSIVRLATIDADGPSGTFVDRLGPLAW